MSRSSRYTIIDKVVTSGDLAYLRCLDAKEAYYVIREVHMECCGDHGCKCSLVYWILRQGYS